MTPGTLSISHLFYGEAKHSIKKTNASYAFVAHACL